MRKVLRIGEKGKVKLDREEREATSDLRSKVAIIQALLLCAPLESLMAQVGQYTDKGYK